MNIKKEVSINKFWSQILILLLSPTRTVPSISVTCRWCFFLDIGICTGTCLFCDWNYVPLLLVKGVWTNGYMAVSRTDRTDKPVWIKSSSIEQDLLQDSCKMHVSAISCMCLSKGAMKLGFEGVILFLCQCNSVCVTAAV